MHELPHDFESDEEIAEWFDEVDLAQYNLERADVEIEPRVRLVLEEDLEAPSSSAAAAGESRLDLVPS